MRVITKKPIRVDTLGLIPKDREVELPKSVAELYLQNGAVELYETKVLRERPYPAIGKEPMLSASPVAQASPQTNASASESGVKPKRKYTRRAASSSSTTATS